MTFPACTHPQVHLQTSSWAHLSTTPLSSGVKAPSDAKEIEQKLLFDSALQETQIPVLCFQLFLFYMFQIILEEQLRGQHCFGETMLFGDQTHITTLLMDVRLSRTDRQHNLSQSQLASTPTMPQARLHFPSRPAAPVPAGVRCEACPGLWCLCGAVAPSVALPRRAACLACRNTQRPRPGQQRFKESKGAPYEFGYYHLKISFSMVTTLTQGHFPAKPPLLPP